MKNKPIWILKFLVFAITALAVLGVLVMVLWNRLVPPIFGLQRITYGQAIGLLLLCRILFGGFRGRPGGRMHVSSRFQRWNKMTPEEREKFRRSEPNSD